MLEYACQRIYRDARITSIYEGTTQLQVVAAIRYVTTGMYSQVISDFEQQTVSEDLCPYMDRLKVMATKFNADIEAVKAAGDQDLLDICARHLYEEAGNLIMAHLLLQNANKAPALFAKSMNVYMNLAESEVEKHHNFIARMDASQLDAYRK